MKYKKIVLVKPPERSGLNFGTFSLGVVAAAVRGMAEVYVIDATDLSIAEAVEKVLALGPDLIGLTAMGMGSVQPVANFAAALKKGGSAASIIAGGHGVTMFPGTVLQAGIDGVVC